jgi:hypothetical protein
MARKVVRKKRKRDKSAKVEKLKRLARKEGLKRKVSGLLFWRRKQN